MILGNQFRDRLASGAKMEMQLTVEGLKTLILEQRAAGLKPVVIILSEKDRRDMNDDLMSMSVEEINKEDAADNRKHLGMIMGVQIRSNPEVENGKARIIHAAPGT